MAEREDEELGRSVTLQEAQSLLRSRRQAEEALRINALEDAVLRAEEAIALADRVLIMLHNDPDPDAMASGLAVVVTDDGAARDEGHGGGRAHDEQRRDRIELPDGSRLVPASTPLLVGGMDPEVLGEWGRRLEPYGIDVLQAGGATVLSARFDPAAAVEQIQAHRVTLEAA